MARTAHKLSDAFVAKPVPDPEGRQLIDWDRNLPGFGCTVSGRTAAKSRVAQRGSEIPRPTIECTVFMPDAGACDVEPEWLRLLGQGTNRKK